VLSSAWDCESDHIEEWPQFRPGSGVAVYYLAGWIVQERGRPPGWVDPLA